MRRRLPNVLREVPPPPPRERPQRRRNPMNRGRAWGARRRAAGARRLRGLRARAGSLDERARNRRASSLNARGGCSTPRRKPRGSAYASSSAKISSADRNERAMCATDDGATRSSAAASIASGGGASRRSRCAPARISGLHPGPTSSTPSLPWRAGRGAIPVAPRRSQKPATSSSATPAMTAISTQASGPGSSTLVADASHVTTPANAARGTSATQTAHTTPQSSVSQRGTWQRNKRTLA